MKNTTATMPPYARRISKARYTAADSLLPSIGQFPQLDPPQC